MELFLGAVFGLIFVNQNLDDAERPTDVREGSPSPVMLKPRLPKEPYARPVHDAVDVDLSLVEGGGLAAVAGHGFHGLRLHQTLSATRRHTMATSSVMIHRQSECDEVMVESAPPTRNEDVVAPSQQDESGPDQDAVCEIHDLCPHVAW